MDTITQGFLGAAAAQAVAGPRPLRRTWLYGAIGGMAADVDMVFEAMADPMLGFRFHRHFTHALAFIPLGGLLVALLFLLPRSNRPHWRAILLATTVGYATHGPLDACTGYGTVLGWPFTEARVALDWVSILDPLVTLFLVVGVVMAARRASARPARIALAATVLYIGFGALQRHRVVAAVDTIAAARGHDPERMRALILVLSNMRWRVFYEADGRAYVHHVAAPWIGDVRVREGPSYPILREGDLDGGVRGDTRTLAAFRRFRWFADGWVGRWPGDPRGVGDMRYSTSTTEAAPMWGIRLRPGGDAPVELLQDTPTVDEVFRSLRGE